MVRSASGFVAPSAPPCGGLGPRALMLPLGVLEVGFRRPFPGSDTPRPTAGPRGHADTQASATSVTAWAVLTVALELREKIPNCDLMLAQPEVPVQPASPPWRLPTRSERELCLRPRWAVRGGACLPREAQTHRVLGPATPRAAGGGFISRPQTLAGVTST